MRWRAAARAVLSAVCVFLLLISSTNAAEDPSGKTTTVQLQYGMGSYLTLATVAFIFSALWADLLIIRLWLIVAYVFIIVNIVEGNPSIREWHVVARGGAVPLGALALNAFCLALHAYAFAQLAWDERPISLEGRGRCGGGGGSGGGGGGDGPNDGSGEAVWRCFFRRCGMPRLECSELLKLGTFEDYSPGAVLYDHAAPGAQLRLMLVVTGVVRMQLHAHTARPPRPQPPAPASPFKPSSGPAPALPSAASLDAALRCNRRDSLGRPIELTKEIRSGGLMGFVLLNLFGIYVGFEGSDIAALTAVTPVRVLCWDVAAIIKMASGAAGSAIPNYWRMFALFGLAMEYALHLGLPPRTYKGEPEDLSSLPRTAMCHDMAAPLTPEERAALRPPPVAWLRWIVNTLSPLPPPGLRHIAAPIGGAAAAARLRVALDLTADGPAAVPVALRRTVQADGNAPVLEQAESMATALSLPLPLPAVRELGAPAAAAAASKRGSLGIIFPSD